MIWKKISVLIPSTLNEEIISDTFMKIGAQGTEIVDDDNDDVKTKVNSYFDDKTYRPELVTELRKEIDGLSNFGFDVDGVETPPADGQLTSTENKTNTLSLHPHKTTPF